MGSLESVTEALVPIMIYSCVRMANFFVAPFLRPQIGKTLRAGEVGAQLQAQTPKPTL